MRRRSASGFCPCALLIMCRSCVTDPAAAAGSWEPLAGSNLSCMNLGTAACLSQESSKYLHIPEIDQMTSSSQHITACLIGRWHELLCHLARGVAQVRFMANIGMSKGPMAEGTSGQGRPSRKHLHTTLDQIRHYLQDEVGHQHRTRVGIRPAEICLLWPPGRLGESECDPQTLLFECCNAGGC